MDIFIIDFKMPSTPESGGNNLTERINNGIKTVEEYAALPLYESDERFQDRVDAADGYFTISNLKFSNGDTNRAASFCIRGEFELVGAKSIIELNSPKDRSSAGK